MDMQRYFQKKPAIFNKYYETNLLQVVDRLPAVNQEQKQKYDSQNGNRVTNNKKAITKNNQQQQRQSEQALLDNSTLAYHHETDRLNQETELNQYLFGGLLGRGAHSVVRLCRDRQKNNSQPQYVTIHLIKACKILSFEKIRKKYFIKTKQLIQMVLNEIIFLKQLKNPKIIAFKQAIYLKQKQKMFLIMEYCGKGSIMRIVDNSLTMEDQDWWNKVKVCFQQFVQGVKHMHQNGIIHRDIKPENLLINDKDQLKIIDFNVSQRLINGEKIKITNKFIGTKGYAAPQLILDLQRQKQCDGKKLDIWAMGITLIQLLQRRHPYPVKTLPQLIRFLQNCKGQNVSGHQGIRDQASKIPMGQGLQINAKYPSQLRDLLSRMLKFQNQQRISIEEIQFHPWPSAE